MNKKCARCEKTVYPTEELKCLDKLWHRQCFKCQVCSMTLNMRNYKGFDKNPYCEAHIPKAKATTVAETPELKRIAENTKLQSNVQYHAEFEKTKGKLTQVADDPETLRIRQNSQIISNVAYHGDLRKKAEMEQRRNITENGKPVEVASSSVVSNGGDKTQLQPTAEARSAANYRNMKTPSDSKQKGEMKSSPYCAGLSTLIYCSNTGAVQQVRSVGSIADIDPVNNCYGSLSGSYYNNASRSGTQQMQHNYQKTDAPKAGNVYRAMYDYEARDSDEVSFHDGDIIVNCVHIHEGWLSGVVQRTGECGLVPANYVESVIV